MAEGKKPRESRASSRIHPAYILLLLIGMAVCLWYLWRVESRRLGDTAYSLPGPLAKGPARVQYVTPRLGWGIDTRGHTLFRTQNGGRNWEVASQFPEETVEEFQFFEDASGFALVNGSLYKTNDGGDRWQKIFPAPEGRPIERMIFFDARTGLFMDRGRNVWRTHDGGRTWQREASERLSERTPRAIQEIPATTETPPPPAAAPISPEEADLRKRIDRASAQFTKGEFEDVLATLEPIEHPTAQIAVLRAWSFYRQHDIDRARQAFLQALALEPSNIQALNGKGYCLYRDYRYDEAEGAFRQVLGRAPENVDALIGLGLIEFYRGRYARAEEIFEKVQRFEPENKEILEYLDKARHRRESGR